MTGTIISCEFFKRRIKGHKGAMRSSSSNS